MMRDLEADVGVSLTAELATKHWYNSDGKIQDRPQALQPTKNEAGKVNAISEDEVEQSSKI
jgi:hypothetical protein